MGNIFDDNIKDSLDEWVYSFKNHEVQDEFNSPAIKELSEKLDYVSMATAEQRKYDKYLMDLASDRGVLEFNSQKSKEEGHAEGRVEERVDQEKSKQVERIRNIKAMMSDGSTLDLISKYTGLSVREIEELNDF